MNLNECGWCGTKTGGVKLVSNVTGVVVVCCGVFVVFELWALTIELALLCVFFSVFLPTHGGVVDFDEFTEMFNKTLVVLEAKMEVEREEKLKEARAWMGDSMRVEQKRIQLRIAEKFRMLKEDRNQSVEEIFVAFDDDGGG
jgi:hypothetical protein